MDIQQPNRYLYIQLWYLDITTQYWYGWPIIEYLYINPGNPFFSVWSKEVIWSSYTGKLDVQDQYLYIQRWDNRLIYSVLDI